MLFQKLLGTNGAGGIELVGYLSATRVGNVSNTINLTGLTGGSASEPSEGDLVVVLFAGGMNGASVSPFGFSTSGYTTAANIFANDTYDSALLVGYKFMGSTVDAQVDFTASGTGYTSGEDPRCALVFVFRGVDQTTPMDVAATTNTGVDSVLANPPSITPITPGAFIVAAGAGAHRGGVQTFSSSDLSPFISVGADGFNDCTIGAGLKEWITGAFNPAQFTFSGSSTTSDANTSVTMALRPA